MHLRILLASLLVTASVAVGGQTPARRLAQNVRQPIRLDARNPHYFRYEGKTIALITDGEHYGSVINAAFDWKTYLATLQADGLNFTRIFGGSYVEVPGTSFGIKHNTLAPESGKLILPWARSSEPGYAGGGNKFDLDKWDPEYFQRLHAFLSEAQRRGIVVEVSLFSSQYGDAQWKVSPLNAANNVNRADEVGWKRINTLENDNLLAVQERYVRKLVREVNAYPNVFFEIQNEPWSDHPQLVNVVNPYLFSPARDRYPNSVEVADADSTAWQTRVVQWITGEEAQLPKRHMIAQCYSNFFAPVRSLAPGVSIMNFHYAYPEAASLNAGVGKAIDYDETGFLGQSDYVYRRQAWNFMMAGGSAFDGLDYSFTTEHPDGTEAAPNGPGGGSPVLRKQLGVLAGFLRALPLEEMKPDYSAVVHADGVVAHALSNGRGIYAMYLDGQGPGQLRLRLPAGRYRGVWIDPATGAETATGPLRSDENVLTLEMPKFTQGLALRLRLY